MSVVTFVVTFCLQDINLTIMLHMSSVCRGYDDDREQNKAPTIQGEVVNNLIHHLNAHKSVGLMGSAQGC